MYSLHFCPLSQALLLNILVVDISLLCRVCRSGEASPVWVQEHSRPCFLAECIKKRLNQARFVLLYFVLFAFSGLYLVFSVCS